MDSQGERRGRPERSLGALGVVVLLGLGGGILLASLLPHGIGLTSDSLLYLNGADSLQNGRGWSRPSGGGVSDPITHFPPLYALTVAAASELEGDTLQAAWLVAILLFAGVIIACGAALIYVDRDPAAGVLAALVLAVSPVLLSVFSWAMSEPLFLLLGVLCLSSLVLGLRKGSLGWILGAGATAALAYLARYIGVALILTGGLLVFLRRGWTPGERVRALAAFGAPVVIGVAAWSARNAALTGTATNRTLVWHAVSLTKWKSPLGLIWTWILPFEFDYPALLATGGVLLILLVVGIVLVVRNRASVQGALEGWRVRPSLAGASAGYIMVYSSMVAASLMFVDAATPVDDRIAAPVYLSLVILLSTAVAAGLRWRQTAWVRAGLLLAVALLILSYGGRTWEMAFWMREDAQGFASRGWQRSPVAAAAREFAPDTVFYTNNPEVLTFLTGVGAYGLPVERDGVTGKVNVDVAEDLAEAIRQLGETGGAVVLFGGPGSEPGWGYLSPLLSVLELHVAASDGRIYVAPDPA